MIDADGLVALAAALEGNARGIDHGVAAGDGDSHRLRHADVGAHQHDLAHVDADVRVRVDEIERLNGLHSPSIEVGETLQLPA